MRSSNYCKSQAVTDAVLEVLRKPIERLAFSSVDIFLRVTSLYFQAGDLYIRFNFNWFSDSLALVPFYDRVYMCLNIGGKQHGQ